jgi:hypothetical protein
MVDMGSKEPHSMTCSPLIVKLLNGRQLNMSQHHLSQEVDIKFSHLPTIKSMHTVVGIVKVSSTTSCCTILRRNCGQILTFSMGSQDGTIAESWFKLSQHGSTLFSVVKRLIFLKEHPDTLDTIATQLVF